MDVIRVRRLQPGDEQTLADLARDAPQFDLVGRSAPDPPLPPDAAWAYLTASHVLHWVAESDGQVVGELLCHHLPMPFAPGGELLLYSIGVREGWRRRGAGSLLMAEMTAWQRTHDVDVVWVLADNAGAREFYRAHGFGPDPDAPDVTYLLRRGVPD